MSQPTLLDLLKKALNPDEDRDAYIKEFQERVEDETELEPYGAGGAELLTDLAFDLELYVYGQQNNTENSYYTNQQLVEEIERVVKKLGSKR